MNYLEFLSVNIFYAAAHSHDSGIHQADRGYNHRCPLLDKSSSDCGNIIIKYVLLSSTSQDALSITHHHHKPCSFHLHPCLQKHFDMPSALGDEGEEILVLKGI